MKPLYLRFRGLHSYREQQEVDFSLLASSGLFGIFGPTGAGKSTVVDAITLALYGNVERAARGTQGIINLNEDICEVAFRFELGESTYLVERVFVRKKDDPLSTDSAKNKHRFTNETSGQVLASAKNEMDKAVEQLLGMGMERFTQTVVLPQGKFDNFLRLKPADRGQMLEEIFHLEEYGDVLRDRAKGLADTLDNSLSLAQRELDLLGDCAPERLREAEAGLAACRAQLAGAAQAKDAATAALQAEQALTAKEAERRQQEQRLRQLENSASAQQENEAKLAQAQKASAIKPLLEHVESRYKEQLQAGQALAEKQQAAQRASAAYQEQQRRQESALQALNQRLSQAQSQAQEAETRLVALQAQVQTLQEAWRQAEQNLEAVRHGNAAALLSSQLTADQPCPVCGSLAHPSPAQGGSADLEAARAAKEQAFTAWQAAGQQQEQAQKQLSQAKDRQVKLAMERSSQSEDTALQTAKHTAESADLAHQLAQKEQESLTKEVEALKAQALAEAEKQGFASVNAAKKALLPEAETARLQAAQQQYQADLQAARLRLAELTGELQGYDAARMAGLEAQAQAANQAWQALLVEEGNRLQALSTLQKNGLRWRELTESARAQRVQRDTARQLQKLLLGKAFVRFLSRERLRELAAEASHTIGMLSNQRYQLQLFEGSQGSDFIIVDQYNGGQKRPVATLSGGEVFLVSLSLALALSRKIEMQGAPLGFFFLDEGFGTLDEETLESVMSILERLPSDRRLVGLISHVAEVKARLPRYLEALPASDQAGSHLRLSIN